MGYSQYTSVAAKPEIWYQYLKSDRSSERFESPVCVERQRNTHPSEFRCYIFRAFILG